MPPELLASLVLALIALAGALAEELGRRGRRRRRRLQHLETRALVAEGTPSVVAASKEGHSST